MDVGSSSIMSTEVIKTYSIRHVSFRLKWGLPKVLFLTSRYVNTPLLMFVTFNQTNLVVTDTSVGLT